ncbi:MAG: 4Fe-4S binding protein [Myxococcales bacterium]|nr:4Fe-4S binding protein [Myxococcales bacterium]
MIESILVLTGIGLLSSVGLGVAARFFAVAVDPRLEEVLKFMPNVNCGACGNPGCAGWAGSLVAGTGSINACPVTSPEARQSLAKLLDLTVTETDSQEAMVFCQGSAEHVKLRFEYRGVPSCKAANMLGGQLGCRYGCLGFGDCKRACPFDAIVVENGLARVIPERCTSCGKCVAACPRSLISVQPASKQVLVLCRNHDRGKEVTSNCKVGCIACGKCVKACPVEAIELQNNVAVINPEKCIRCGACARVCPTHSIADFAGPHYTARINEHCTGCTLCARVCPSRAITGERKEKHVVDAAQCVRCHKCHDTCNFEAIEMVDEQGVIQIAPRPKKTKQPSAAKESA